MLELYGHPFSSYTWKALIPLYENGAEFVFRMMDANHPDNAQRLQALSPQGKFPLLADGDNAFYESTIIIEYLQHHYPGATTFIPEALTTALEVRTLDRFFDNYVMSYVQSIVEDAIRQPTGCTRSTKSFRPCDNTARNCRPDHQCTAAWKMRAPTVTYFPLGAPDRD